MLKPVLLTLRTDMTDWPCPGFHNSWFSPKLEVSLSSFVFFPAYVPQFLGLVWKSGFPVFAILVVIVGRWMIKSLMIKRGVHPIFGMPPFLILFIAWMSFMMRKTYFPRATEAFESRIRQFLGFKRKECKSRAQEILPSRLRPEKLWKNRYNQFFLGPDRRVEGRRCSVLSCFSKESLLLVRLANITLAIFAVFTNAYLYHYLSGDIDSDGQFEYLMVIGPNLHVSVLASIFLLIVWAGSTGWRLVPNPDVRNTNIRFLDVVVLLFWLGSWLQMAGILWSPVVVEESKTLREMHPLSMVAITLAYGLAATLSLWSIVGCGVNEARTKKWRKSPLTRADVFDGIPYDALLVSWDEYGKRLQRLFDRIASFPPVNVACTLVWQLGSWVLKRVIGRRTGQIRLSGETPQDRWQLSRWQDEENIYDEGDFDEEEIFHDQARLHDEGYDYGEGPSRTATDSIDPRRRT